MKNLVLYHVIRMTKLFTYAFLIQCLSMSILFASNGNAQVKDIEEVLISISLEDTKIEKAFSAIEKMTGFVFVYTDRELKNIPKVTTERETQSVYELLSVIGKQTGLNFKQVNQNIHVRNGIAQSQPLVQVSDQEASVYINISGTVSDENGEPIPGATVLIEGTSTGTATDIDGNFTIDAQEGAVLLISFIGYQSQRVTVGAQSNINISLIEDQSSLDEVVVIGYGTTKRSDLTGAVGSVTEDQLRERPSTTLNQALSGRVTGVQVNINSGRPGGRTNVRIRGFSSINSSNNPLYVIDGVMMPVSNQVQATQAIDFVNPNDIVSVEVLKDASSTAIYGARGANGVILITTKRGESGEGKISYDADFSVAAIGPNRLEVLNVREFMEVEDLAFENIKKYDPEGWEDGRYNHLNPAIGRSDPRLFDSNGNPIYDTDWLKEATHNKISQNHQLGFTGGNERTTYSLSLGYREDQGLIKESYLKRYSARFTLDDQVKKWLRIGGTLSYNNQDENIVDQDYQVMRTMAESYPFQPVKYEDGNWADNRDYPNSQGNFSTLRYLYERKYILTTQSLIGSLYSNINLAKGLEMRTVLGANVMTQENKQFTGRGIAINQRGTSNVSNRRESFWSLENYLTYNKTFGEIHKLTGLIGLSWQETNFFSMVSGIQNFPTDFFEFNNIGAGSTNPLYGSNAYRFAFNSYFGRINYSIYDKYLLTLTGRVDGSSKFGENHKFAFFPSMALAWRISEEDFLKNNDVIYNLKLRASYGVTGNSEIPPYSSLSILGSGYAGIIGNQRRGGTGIGRLANPDLRWEKTAQSDIGVEIGLLRGRISLEADLYYRKTTDMLLDAPVPRTSSYATIRKNVGSMENKGFEFAINTINIEAGDFSWNTVFNISMNRNKVLTLATPSDIFGVGGPNFTNPTNIIRVGEPVGSFWGLVREGIWSEAERDLAANFTSYRGGLTLLPGDIKYRDVNGDNAITDADRMIIGNGSPDGWGTFLNSFRYKNLDLTLELQYMYGNDVLDMTKHTMEDRIALDNSYRTVLDAWTPENQNTMVPEIRHLMAGYVTNVDTRWIQDGSFIRGKNLLLGYSLPENLISQRNISRFRLFASLENFFLVTNYTSGDPEVAPMFGGDGNNIFSQGQNFFAYPRPKTYRLGLQIGL
ncbi:SusC/RagA family TonB-linked outer membrane protein [Lunatibacter salilacus]|uniref:SusC/RagA family TonB-linked outer membrane protein n=1 Tax=Lunatibacter salilacus TaxID=2483804 RepID=UPI001F2E9D22|nr:TonB-dependent receptor [Lunatibacter salilacus]